MISSNLLDPSYLISPVFTWLFSCTALSNSLHSSHSSLRRQLERDTPSQVHCRQLVQVAVTWRSSCEPFCSSYLDDIDLTSPHFRYLYCRCILARHSHYGQQKKIRYISAELS